MKTQIEAILGRLFPPALPQFDGNTVIIEPEPSQSEPLYAPLRESEQGVQNLREHEPRAVYANGIERTMAEMMPSPRKRKANVLRSARFLA